jgi:NAD(P)-dependent dehydrogenase (short-subunit alcohol dehydrogenase family)
MSGSLNGRRALVTAGASGIGRVIAARLTEAGARCMVCDVDAAALDEYASAFGAVRADVADEAQVDALFAEVKRQLGGLDILVNNAGISGPTLPAEELSLDDWRRMLAVNLDGHFLCARHAIPLLRAAGGGSIVNMSSIGGRLGYPNRAAYAAAKWGIVGFTKTLSIELGPDGIRVNAIQPGMVEGSAGRTCNAREGRSPRHALRGPSCPRAAARRHRRGYRGARRLLVDDGGRNISGQAIPVDGDATSLG